jgi:peptidoglycan/LPS O-acetylase OafA/YrhL
MRIDDKLLRSEANNFTLARVLLASSVIYSHAYSATTGLDGTDDAAVIFGSPLGGVAVEGFFFLSGFLVYASLLRMGGSGRFALARLARLWPGLAVCVLLTTLGGWWASTDKGLSYLAGDTARFIFGNLTFFKGYYSLTGVRCGADLCNVNGSLWSLPWEVRCYAVLAVLGLLRLATPERMAKFVLPATLAYALAWDIPAVRDLVTRIVGHGAAFQIDVMHRLWPLFALGAAAYIFRARIVLSWWILAALFAANFALQTFEIGLQARSLFLGYAVLCIGLRTAAGGAVSGRWPDYSYGIYIYAYPIMDVIDAFWRPTSHWALAAVTLAATVPVAALSWHFVEKPALDTFRRWSGRSARPASSAEQVPAVARAPKPSDAVRATD